MLFLGHTAKARRPPAVFVAAVLLAAALAVVVGVPCYPGDNPMLVVVVEEIHFDFLTL